MVKEEQKSILSTPPLTAKLSIALDCWTSPFQRAFMAINGYFIDHDWNYCETLLGFEPLHGTQSGANLSTVLLELLQKYNIVNQVLADFSRKGNWSVFFFLAKYSALIIQSIELGCDIWLGQLN